MGTATNVSAGVAVVLLLAGAGWWIMGPSPEGTGISRTSDASRGGAAEFATGPGVDVGLSAPGSRSGRSIGDSSHPTPATVASAERATPLSRAVAIEERLTDAEFHALETAVDAGHIEGIVMAGRKPLAGGRARLWANYMMRVFGSDSSAEPTMTVSIGPDGVFAMSGVAPGNYALELDTEGSTSRLMNFLVPPVPGTTTRLVLALESAGVAGRVFDRLGKAAVGVVVHVNPRGSARGFPVNSETRTKSDGSYEIGGLPAGPYWIVAHLGADWWKARDDRTKVFAAAAGVVTIVDLGTEGRADAIWSGVVRMANGKAVHGPGTFTISTKQDDSDTVSYDADGGFSKRLSPGTYGVSVALRGYAGADYRRARTPVDVTIAEHDLARDVVIPGARVSGRVRATTSGEALAKRLDQWVSLTPEGRDFNSRESVSLRADGSFEIDAVTPGRYVVSGWPLSLHDSSLHPVTLVVPEGESEVTIELWATRE